MPDYEKLQEDLKILGATCEELVALYYHERLKQQEKEASDVSAPSLIANVSSGSNGEQKERKGRRREVKTVYREERGAKREGRNVKRGNESKEREGESKKKEEQSHNGRSREVRKV